MKMAPALRQENPAAAHGNISDFTRGNKGESQRKCEQAKEQNRQIQSSLPAETSGKSHLCGVTQKLSQRLSDGPSRFSGADNMQMFIFWNIQLCKRVSNVPTLGMHFCVNLHARRMLEARALAQNPRDLVC